MSQLLHMVWWQVGGALEEGHILLYSLIDLCADAACQQQLQSLQVWRIHLHYSSHVSSLLVHGLNGYL